MAKAKVAALFFVSILTLTTSIAMAACSSGDQNINDVGSAVFGLRWDGTMIGGGQSFTLDCEARFLTASFEFNVVEGGDMGGQPYLLSTDIMIMELLDMSYNVLATTSIPLGFSDGTQWIHFDVSDQNVTLTPGDYLVGCRTEAPRLASIMYDPEDTHAGSRYHYWINEWTGPSAGSDNCFQATWDPNEVPTDRTSWGTMKTSYR